MLGACCLARRHAVLESDALPTEAEAKAARRDTRPLIISRGCARQCMGVGGGNRVGWGGVWSVEGRGGAGRCALAGGG